MKTWMLAFVLLCAGCLHPQAVRTNPSVAPERVREFEGLVNDAKTIADAAELIDRERWPSEVWRPIADKAYWSFIGAEVYVSAAEIGSRFKLGPTYVSFAVRRARERAHEEFGLAREADFNHAPGAQSEAPRFHRDAGERFLRQQIAAACGFGVSQRMRRQAVMDAQTVYEFMGASHLALYDLFERKCPLLVEEQTAIIEIAYRGYDYERAIRYAERSFWTHAEIDAFTARFFSDGVCAWGFPAAARLDAADGAVIDALRNADCERAPIETKRWSFQSQGQAGAFFFAAVSGGEYGLALALAPFTGLMPQAARTYMVREAFLAHDEYELLEILPLDHELKNTAFGWALENGRARFVGNVAQDIVWQQRAFDKLIEIGKFEDAAEVAEYGVSQTLKTTGISLAFAAAVKAKDLDAVRYFLYRYDKQLTEADYAREWKSAHGSKPPELHPKRRKIKRKPCPKTDDWEVERCE